MGKAMLPAVAQLKVGDHGKPVALPSKLTAKTGQPAWVAMNDKALAIGFGQGEKAKLSSMLKASTGQGGAIVRGHIQGKLYAAWLDAMSHHLAQSQAKLAAKHPQSTPAQKHLANARANLAAMSAKFKHLKDVTFQAHVTRHGIRLTSDTHWK